MFHSATAAYSICQRGKLVKLDATAVVFFIQHRGKLLLGGTDMSHGFRAGDLPLNRDEITDVDIN